MHLLSQKKWPILIGLAPAIIVYFLFAIIPIVISFYYSLMDWDGFTKMTFVGLANFKEVFNDPIFWQSLKNNLYVLAASVFGQVPIALFFALLLNRKLKGGKFFRTVGFMPVVISTVVISLVWGMMYNARIGLFNQFLKIIGLEQWAQNWLGDPKWAMVSVSITIIWQFVGLYLIIFLAALQNIPQEIYDASEIDGASGLKQTIYIVLPMIWDTIIVAVILCISGSLRTFDLIYVMTSGGPGHATEVMAMYMFDKTFSSTRYGYGSAISLCIFFFSLALIYISNLILRRKTV
ncbi:raffinose/stachyose/melibiose transport system permease protein [Anoxybacillus tepidamans]|uniref:Raffinose/stachyose/melibiose transport system permease protein n=1 Tax=Anoxybacteroides tepidamans TaxID=265948 RepID=A0A7W8ITQ4_9BACL|nr:sugar ABC transporter permease [Anoxybacillus tepidamans]MBB5325741.1 raffinose/stachyose/melibiose transport system permease protein [Anoxybacillus tepidamans]